MKNQLEIDSSIEKQATNYLSECINDDKLTEQEHYELSRLLKKALAPSKEILQAVDSKDIKHSPFFTNIPNAYLLWNSNAITFGKRFTEVSLTLGGMYGKYLIDNDIKDVSVKTFNDFILNAGLPPNILDKPTVFTHFLMTFLDDPLEILLNYNKIFDNMFLITTKSIVETARFVLQEHAVNQSND